MPEPDSPPALPQVPPRGVLTSAEATDLLHRMMALVRGLSDGSVRVEDQSAPTKKLTVREQRAQLQASLSDATKVMERLGLRGEIPEPRRQRKQRHLPPRRVYSARLVKTREQLEAIQHLTPAATSVVVYLANHPRSTVPDVSAALDLKRKTVENVLSILVKKSLVVSESR